MKFFTELWNSTSVLLSTLWALKHLFSFVHSVQPFDPFLRTICTLNELIVAIIYFWRQPSLDNITRNHEIPIHTLNEAAFGSNRKKTEIVLALENDTFFPRARIKCLTFSVCGHATCWSNKQETIREQWLKWILLCNCLWWAHFRRMSTPECHIFRFHRLADRKLHLYLK